MHLQDFSTKLHAFCDEIASYFEKNDTKIFSKHLAASQRNQYAGVAFHLSGSSLVGASNHKKLTPLARQLRRLAHVANRPPVMRTGRCDEHPDKGNKMTSKQGTLKKVGVASFIMMASVFASRVIGLCRELAIAYAGGAGGGAATGVS